MNIKKFLNIRKDIDTYTYPIIKSIVLIIVGVLDFICWRPFCDSIPIEWLSKMCILLSGLVIILVWFGLISACCEADELKFRKREQAKPICREQIRKLFINEIIEICKNVYSAKIVLLYNDRKVAVGHFFYKNNKYETEYISGFFIDQENNREERIIPDEETFRSELEHYATVDGEINVISISNRPPEKFLQSNEKCYAIFQRLQENLSQTK